MKRTNKEIIRHIREELLDYEAEYDHGAWERFNKPPAAPLRQKTWLWRGMAAAAIILIAGFLFLRQQEPGRSEFANKPDSSAKVIQDNIASARSDSGKSAGTAFEDHRLAAVASSETGLAEQAAGLENDRFANVARSAIEYGAEQPAVVAAQVTSAATAQVPAESATAGTQAGNSMQTAKGPVGETPNTTTRQPDPFEKMLAAADDKGPGGELKPTPERRGLQLGMVLAPALGNDEKVNLGYGIAVTYALNKKLSLTSGLTYSAMSTFKDVAFQPPAVQDFPAATTTFNTPEAESRLESVNASIRGLSVPLELRYHISEKIYAGAGVSAMAILNQRQQNNYLVPKIAPQSYATAGGQMETRNMVVTQRETRQLSGEELNNNARYLGFYNLSVGFRQKINSRNAVALEPFLRVPMKDFSKDNLNLTDAGLRLRFDF
ncbi:hypothetical protein [Pedobacter sp. SYP-B3415]|uniref:hypothetical protein n=1 Tax=Pedobacter sp. SYP-B3415 TaxID=2496641 RepID=UPI00101DFAEC|nr:hypothetical protein [Pedobacter sp. SYP-B3415]